MARMTRILIAAAAAFVTATACSAGDDDASDQAESGVSSGDGAAEPGAPDDGGDTAENEATDGGGETTSLVTAALQTAAGRDIIHTVSLSVETDDVATAAANATTIALSAGGWIADETTHGDDEAHLTLKIPVDAHIRAVGEIEGLGDVVERTRSAEDVTDQVVDTESRIDSQRASIARTRDLLQSATDIDQIIRIEDELSRREADLDALLRTREELSALSSMATIDVTFSTSIAEEPAQATGFLAGLRGGWDAFVGAMGAAATVLGALLPFLVTAAILGLPVLWWRRRHHRATPVVAQSDAPSA